MHITPHQAAMLRQRMGAPVAQPRRKRGTDLHQLAFLRMVAIAGLPTPTTEHRFHPERRWRFDYAWPSAKVALEVDGGVWIQGRHTRGSGRIGDMEKFSEAACAGWRVLYVTPQQLATAGTVDMIRRAVEARKDGEA